VPFNRLPSQRWTIYPSTPEKVEELARSTGLSPLLAQVLVNRGVDTPETAKLFLDPDLVQLSSPLEAFGADLEIALELLAEAIANESPIAICGDYDADGMTSTALLMRAFKYLGAIVDYAIPSRMKDGYGINDRLVKQFAEDDVRVIVTVDNGISACQPVELARELGLDVIITDHHDLPIEIPPANAILNPKMLPPHSPYRGLAGVGVAYILAIALAQKFDKDRELVRPLRELFTLGTIADLAPLVGVNRRWLKKGLRSLPKSPLLGVRSLIQEAGIDQMASTLKPEDIGFKLGPRINAVGRIGDPQIVIELLTTEDPGLALERAMQCEQLNQERQEMCHQITEEAIAWYEANDIDLHEERVLVIVQPEWHHGVIGLVASRLVERYGVPVFIGTYEDEECQKVRGSARGIPEFNVFESLQFCDDLLGKYGGHKAAGGFSCLAENLPELRSRLKEFAYQCLELKHLKPLITVDAQADFSQISLDLYHQIDRLHPCGIGNDPPVFWTPNVRVLEQRSVGKGHIKFVLGQNNCKLEAIAWRWADYLPLPSHVDLAYKVQKNAYNGYISVQLEVVGARLPKMPQIAVSPKPKTARFECDGRHYSCRLYDRELRVRNDRGQVLALELGQQTALLGTSRDNAKVVSLANPKIAKPIQLAMQVLQIDL